MIKQVQIHLPELHRNQQKILQTCKRFNAVCCGRRFGKTVLAEELLLSPDDARNGALNGFPVAYFAPSYKMLMEVWRDIVQLCQPITSTKSELEKRIELVGGGVIDMWSLDAPDTIRGRKYKRIIVDEAASVHDMKYAWNEVMRPMLTDLKGDAWFLSTPKGKSNYFYNLSQNAEKYPTWAFFQMPTTSNPHIDPQEVEEAREQLDPLTFAQEYLATFVTQNLDAFAYCFVKAKHVQPVQYNAASEIILSFDFNRVNGCCGVFQRVGGVLYCLEIIQLNNSNTYDMCDVIKAKYGGKMMLVTGDATGKASSALVKDNINHYQIIKQRLGLGNSQFKVPTHNPTIEENRVMVNSVFHMERFIINSTGCQPLIQDLEYAQMLPDGSLDKSYEKSAVNNLNALDTCRYAIGSFMRDVLKFS